MRRLAIMLMISASYGVAQNSPVYPAALPTHEDLLIVSNRASDELASGISAGDTSITLNSAAEFPALGANEATIIRIENEYIKICGKSGNVLTVCTSGRGFDGSSAASHATGSAVTGTFIAWLHNQIAAEVISLATTRQFPCRSSTELTIASGAITVTGSGCFRIDTELDAASDDLTTVNCTAGDRFIFWAEDGARTVVLKAALGLIADFQLDNTADQWEGSCRTTDQVSEIGRSNNGG